MEKTENRLLFVTNLRHQDREEDLYLANRLSDEWNVTLADANDAARIARTGDYRRIFIRNAWPSFDFDPAFSILESLVHDGVCKSYNPPSDSRGFHENKSYLGHLYKDNFPVIPTFLTKETLRNSNEKWANHALYKPLGGCSSIGIVTGAVEELPNEGGVYQPFLQFTHEVSFFFIDNRFVYALRSRDHENRWELSEFDPSEYDLDWAYRFIKWNKLPYGIQRIDGGRTSDGKLWLTEIEDFLPYLSLSVLEGKKRDTIVNQLLSSVRSNLDY